MQIAFRILNLSKNVGVDSRARSVHLVKLIFHADFFLDPLSSISNKNDTRQKMFSPCMRANNDTAALA